MCISHGPGIATGQIQSVFKFKGDKMEQPEIYIGDQVRNIILDGSEGCYMPEDKCRILNKISQNLTNTSPHVIIPLSCLSIVQEITLRPILKM